MRRAILISLLLPFTAAASGDPEDLENIWDRGARADATVENGGVNTGVQIGQSGEEGTDLSPAAPVRTGLSCAAEAVGDGFERSAVLADDAKVHRAARFYYWVCADVRQLRWYVPGVSLPTDDEALAPLVDEAFDRIEPPPPVLVTSPPLGSEVLTGLPMYLAVGDEAFSELSGSVSAGQFTVTASVVPVSSWFWPGDGGEARTCAGAGSVWSSGERPSEGDCTHTFTHTPVHLHGEGETFGLRARVTYEASYTVEGPVLAGSYELGTFEGPESVVEVPVIERRAVRTTTNG